jgi:hypothetical protein
MLKSVKKNLYNKKRKHLKSQHLKIKIHQIKEIEGVHTWVHHKQMLRTLDVACAWD